MVLLQTMRLKPNPVGKDRSRYGARPEQLAGEWADLQNTGNQPVDLRGVVLKHVAYRSGVAQGYWEPVFSFASGVLRPGQTVRIHAGENRGNSVIRPEDLAGAEFHLFSGRDQYVWNNDRSDCASLWVGGQNNYFDCACYDGPPPEGAVLVRSGSKLVVPSFAGMAAGR